MNQRKNKSVIFLVILSSVFLFSGCFGVNTEFRSIRNSLLQNNKSDFDRTFELSVGQAGMLLASMIIRMADESEYSVDELLAQVSRVQIGVYELEDHVDFADINCKEMLGSIDAQMKNEGWHYIVKTRDHGEIAAVFIRDNILDEFSEMFVVAFSGEELVLVQLNGDLDNLIQIAIREHGLKFQMAKN